MSRYPTCLLLALFLVQTPARAEQHAAPALPAMDEYVTCAVYFRMVAGSIRSRMGQDSYLSEVAEDKMSALADQARARAASEFGRDKAEGKFEAAWKATLKDMTDQINRNYANITRLRVRYNDRCEALFKSLDAP